MNHNIDKILNKLYAQIMLYTQHLGVIKSLVEEKYKLGLPTQQLRIFWVSLGLITTKTIYSVIKIGGENCKIYGIEQGMMPMGIILSTNLLQSPLSFVPPFSQIKKYFENISLVTSYAQEKDLSFIVGTVNNLQWVRLLIQQGVNGIVPDDPKIFSLAGVTTQGKIKLYEEHRKYYIPSSMKERLNTQ